MKAIGIERRGWVFVLLVVGTLLAAGTESSRGQTTINSSYQWQDRGGTTFHPLQNINVEFWDDDSVDTIPTADDPFGTFTSNNLGTASVVELTDFDPIPLDTTWEIYTQVRAEITGVASYRATHASADPLKLRLPIGNGFFPVTEGAINNVGPSTIVNQSNTHRAFGVLQHVNHIRDYYNAAPFNATLPAITIATLPNTDAANMAGNQMNLGDRAWHDIDVIMHEYGHHVQEHNNLRTGTLGNSHTFGVDNIGALNGGQNLGATTGSRLAWQEGGATVLGMMAIHDGNLATSIPGLPAGDLDLAYDDFTQNTGANFVDNTDLSFAVNVESRSVTTSMGGTGRQGGTYNTFNFAGAGEGDEMSLLRAVWDFKDAIGGEIYARGSDMTTVGATNTYNLMVGNGTLYDYWRDLNSQAQVNEGWVGLPVGAAAGDVVSSLGFTLEEYAVSAIPLTTGVVADSTPTISWTEQNNDNSIFWKVLIYSDDWNTLEFDSGRLGAGVVGDVGGALENHAFTVPLADALSNGAYNYVILNDPALSTTAELDASNFNYYWSGVQTLTIVPEPVAMALVALGVFCLLGATPRRSRR